MFEVKILYLWLKSNKYFTRELGFGKSKRFVGGWEFSDRTTRVKWGTEPAVRCETEVSEWFWNTDIIFIFLYKTFSKFTGQHKSLSLTTLKSSLLYPLYFFLHLSYSFLLFELQSLLFIKVTTMIKDHINLSKFT